MADWLNRACEFRKSLLERCRFYTLGRDRSPDSDWNKLQLGMQVLLLFFLLALFLFLAIAIDPHRRAFVW